MELLLDTPTSLEVEEFIDSYTQLTDICFMGNDLSYLGDFSTGLYSLIRGQENLSVGMENILKNDAVFINYLPKSEKLTTKDYLVGIENAITDVFSAICNFFKRLSQGLIDFIKKLFSLRRNISETNTENIKRLKPYFDKFQDSLNSIPASTVIPHSTELEKILSKTQSVTSNMLKLDISSLDKEVLAVLSGKEDTKDFNINYEKLLGSKYVEILKSIGIDFQEDMPVFESVFVNTKTSSSIGRLGYNYGELVSLNNILIKQIDPLQSHLQKLTKTLEQISNVLTKLENRISEDEKNNDKYTPILKTLPNEVSKLIGLFQKISLASLTYEYKLSEVITCLFNDFRSYTK